MQSLFPFLGSLRTLLGLRLHLHFRGLRLRTPLGRLFGQLEPFVLLLFVGMVYAFIRSVSQTVVPELVLLVAGLLLAVAHVFVLFEVVARVGRGEGMAVALYHYPLSPLLIHAAEVGQALLSVPVLASSVALSALLGALEVPALLAVPWMLIWLLYLASLRQLLQLVVGRLLRRRFLRELSIALLSTVGLLGWLGLNWVVHNGAVAELVSRADGLPTAYWLLPLNWVVAPSELVLTVQPLALPLAAVGLTLLLVAVFVVGADMQEQACLGEAGGRAVSSQRGPRRRRLHLADRLPLSVIPVAVWASASKELTVMRRDPFVWVMILSQGVFLLVPPLIFGGPGGAAAFYMPILVMMLLLVESAPVFNVIAGEGRALHFLAQSPAPRWQVLVGKNLAYGQIYFVFNAAFLALAGFAYGELERYGLYLAMSCYGLVMLLGLGNLVSVFLPTAWIGARGAEGGSRAAHRASEGGVEQPGCLTLMLKLMFVQVLYLLAIPPTLLVVLGSSSLGESWWLLVSSAIVAWSLLVYLVATGLALWRLGSTEQRILERFSTRGAS